MFSCVVSWRERERDVTGMYPWSLIIMSIIPFSNISTISHFRSQKLETLTTFFAFFVSRCLFVRAFEREDDGIRCGYRSHTTENFDVHLRTRESCDVDKVDMISTHKKRKNNELILISLFRTYRLPTSKGGTAL